MWKLGCAAVAVVACGCGATAARPRSADDAEARADVAPEPQPTPPASIDLTAYGADVASAAAALDGSDLALAHQRVVALAEASPPPFGYLAARLLFLEGYRMLPAMLLVPRVGDGAIDAETLRWIVFLARVEPALRPTLEELLGSVSEAERTALYASLDPESARFAENVAARTTCHPSLGAEAHCPASEGASALDAESRLRLALFRLHAGELDVAEPLLAAAAQDPASTAELRAFAWLIYGHVSLLRAEAVAPHVFDSDQLPGEAASAMAHRALDAWARVTDDPTYGAIARTAMALVALRIGEPRRALTVVDGLSLASASVPRDVVWIRGRARSALCLDSARAGARMTQEEAEVAARGVRVRALGGELSDETVLAFDASLDALAQPWPAPGSRAAVLLDAAIASDLRPRLDARDLAWGRNDDETWFEPRPGTLRESRAALAALTVEAARVHARAEPDPWLEQTAFMMSSFARDQLADAIRSRLAREADDASPQADPQYAYFVENLRSYFAVTEPFPCTPPTTATDLASMPNDP
jgi:hypothetical protein